MPSVSPVHGGPLKHNKKTSPNKKDQKFSLTKRDDLRGLILNKQGYTDFRREAAQVPDAEFLYLRDNEFVNFDPGLMMYHLKVLDLSQNNLRQINFIPYMPYLRHLYLTGNQLDSFAGLTDLEELETLCISNNRISCFKGLGSILPNLRVLSANNNLISDFNNIPYLPSLYQLSLQGNPISSNPNYRKLAIAVCSDQLTKIDSQVVTREELEDTHAYRGKVAYCIGQGFVGGNTEGTLQEQCDRFLLEKQRETTRDHSLVLQSINLQGTLREGDPITLHVCLQDRRPLKIRQSQKFHSEHIFPVELQVQGDAREVFVVGSMNLWQEPLELERCVDNKTVFFHTTLYLPVGEYEYRYIVNGEEKVSEHTKTLSKFNQGVCNVYKVTGVAPSEHDESRTLLHIRWLRSNCNSGFDLIERQNSLVYTPTSLDVNTCLRAEVLSYCEANYETAVFDITPPIVCGLPSCPRLEFVGRAAEGVELKAIATYSGGVENGSTYQWFRVENRREIPLNVDPSSHVYIPVGADVGHQIKVVYTPVREDGMRGDKRSAVSRIVEPCPPQVKHLIIDGQLAEGCSVHVVAEYCGGQEGRSRVRWYKEHNGRKELIPDANDSRSYVIRPEDVGSKIGVEYTPVSLDGREGIASTYFTDTIGAGHPQIINISLQGPCRELTPLTLAFDFVGGRPGNHIIQWYRLSGKQRTPIPTSNPMSYVCRNGDIGSIISVHVVPVREDGTQGEARIVESQPISAGPPTILSMNLRCRSGFIEGDVVSVEPQYCGGREGATIVQWFRSDERGQNWTIIPDLPTTRSRNLTHEDVGRKLRCTVTPVRDDGVQGTPTSRETDFIQKS